MCKLDPATHLRFPPKGGHCSHQHHPTQTDLNCHSVGARRTSQPVLRNTDGRRHRPRESSSRVGRLRSLGRICRRRRSLGRSQARRDRDQLICSSSHGPRICKRRLPHHHRHLGSLTVLHRRSPWCALQRMWTLLESAGSRMRIWTRLVCGRKTTSTAESASPRIPSTTPRP